MVQGRKLQNPQAPTLLVSGADQLKRSQEKHVYGTEKQSVCRELYPLGVLFRGGLTSFCLRFCAPPPFGYRCRFYSLEKTLVPENWSGSKEMKPWNRACLFQATSSFLGIEGYYFWPNDWLLVSLCVCFVVALHHISVSSTDKYIQCLKPDVCLRPNTRLSGIFVLIMAPKSCRVSCCKSWPWWVDHIFARIDHYLGL